MYHVQSVAADFIAHCYHVVSESVFHFSVLMVLPDMFCVRGVACALTLAEIHHHNTGRQLNNGLLRTLGRLFHLTKSSDAVIKANQAQKRRNNSRSVCHG